MQNLVWVKHACPTPVYSRVYQVQRLKEQQDSMKAALLAAMDGLSQAQARQQDSAGSVAEEVKAANRATVDQLSSRCWVAHHVKATR